MRHSHTLLTAAALLLPIGLGSLAAQQTAAPRPNMAQRTIEEKVLKRLEWLKQIEQNGGVGALSSSSSKSAATDEIIVSGEPEVESEVHAAMNPLDTGNIIVSPIRSSTSLGEGVQCPIYFTRDFGSTWTKSVFKTVPMVEGSTVFGGGDPVLAFDGNGTAYLSWLAFYAKGGSFSAIYYAMFWASSTDGGETWTRSERGTVVENEGSLGGGGVVVDKQWMAVDRTGGAYNNTLYVSFLEANSSTNVSRIALRFKRPGSAEFTDSSVNVSGDGFNMVQFTDIDIDPSGGVHVSFFGSEDGQQYALYHASSSDGGESFTPPVKIANLYVPNFSEAKVTIPGIDTTRMYPCPHIAIDRSGSTHRGTLYATWAAWGQTGKDGNGLDIFLSRSSDNGATWSTPSVVNDDERGVDANQYHPSIAVSPNGVVAVTWYDRRNDPQQRSTNYTIAYSFDGGATFSKNYPVSATPTDFSTVGSRNGKFGVGEYTQVLTTGSYAIPVWTDGRENNGDLDIYAARVPIRADLSGVEAMTAVDERYAVGEPRIDPQGELHLPVTRIPDGAALNLTLVSLDGRTVEAWQNLPARSGSTLAVKLNQHPAGRYLLRVESRQGPVAARSLLIVR